MKDYEAWMKKKEGIEEITRSVFFSEREIWWASLGINIGMEIDGKNENFERPVLVLYKYNKDTLFILPLTTRVHDDIFHYFIEIEEKKLWIKLNQGRVISRKRLIRKKSTLAKDIFLKLMSAWIDLFTKKGQSHN